LFRLTTIRCLRQSREFDAAAIQWYLYRTADMPSQAPRRALMKKWLADGKAAIPR
jgi:hypothetical protein